MRLIAARVGGRKMRTRARLRHAPASPKVNSQPRRDGKQRTSCTSFIATHHFGYHSLDATGVVMEINDTELAWLGYGREEVVGKMRISDLMPTQRLDWFEDAFARLKDRGSLHDVEYEMRRKAFGSSNRNSTVCRGKKFDMSLPLRQTTGRKRGNLNNEGKNLPAALPLGKAL